MERSPKESPTFSRKREKPPADYRKLYVEAQRQNQALQKDNKDLAMRIKKGEPKPEATGGVEEEGVDMAVDGTKAELKTAVADAAKALKDLEGVGPSVQDLIPDYESVLAAARERLREAQAAKRAANPLKQQLASAKAHRGKMEAQLQAAKDSLEERQVCLMQIQQCVMEDTAKVEELEELSCRAEEDVASLVAQLAEEDVAALPADRPAPSAINLGDYVSRAFAMAEFEKWTAERNAEVAMLQAIIAGQQAAASTDS